MTSRERRLLLGVLGFLSFSTVYTNLVAAPVLSQLAGEFHVTTGTAGLVVAAYGLPGIVTALVAGPYSDRYGRRRFLIGGSLVMGVLTIVAAFAPTFELLLVARALAGVGASVVFPNVNATIGDRFAYRERGRALSTVIGMNTLATIVGVPIAGIVAEATTWRVSLAIVGTLAVIAGLTLARALPPGQRGVDVERARALYARILRNPSAVAAVASSFLGALYWFTWVTYLVVFFERTYTLSQGLASTFALTLGLGLLPGSQLGGRLGDRIGHRRIVAGSIALSSLLLLLLTNAPLGLFAGAATNLGLSAVIGARFSTNAALLTEQVPEARGTMLAISAALGSAALVAGATIGGALIDAAGFPAVGIFCAGAALLSSAIVLRFVHEEPIDLETQPV